MIHEPLPHPNEPPFVADIAHAEERPGYPVPRCRVVLGAGLRELARDMGVEAVGYLAVVMGFATANGTVGPSAADVASALGRPEWPVRRGLLRLTRLYWRGQPLLRTIRRASGWETFHPLPIVLGVREAPPRAAAPAAAPAGSAAVIEASRAVYSRPREEAERVIRSLQGWPHPDELDALAEATAAPPDDLDGRWAAERLSKAGVDYSLAVRLVNEYGAERCLRQLRLLPYRRGIKNRSRYVVWAIQSDHPAPGAGEGGGLADDQAAHRPA